MHRCYIFFEGMCLRVRVWEQKTFSQTWPLNLGQGNVSKNVMCIVTRQQRQCNLRGRFCGDAEVVNLSEILPFSFELNVLIPSQPNPSLF